MGSERCLGEWVENLSCVWMENILHCLYTTALCWGSSLKLERNALTELSLLIFKKEILTSELFNKYLSIFSTFSYVRMSAIALLMSPETLGVPPTLCESGETFEGRAGSWPNWTGAFFGCFLVRERECGCVWLSYCHHVKIPSIFLPRTRSGAAAKCFQ